METVPSITRRWNYRWNVLVLTMLSQGIVIGIQSFAFSFWLVPWMHEFAASRSQLMLIITLSNLAGGLYSPLIGLSLDRLPVRLLFTAGVIVLAGSLFAISLAHSLLTIQIIYGGVLPVSVAICGQLGCQTVITRWFHRGRGFASGASALGVPFGAFLSPPAVTLMLAAYGWRTSFQVLAIGSLILLGPACWAILGRSPPPDENALPHSGPAPSSLNSMSLLKNRDFWIIAFAFGALLFASMPVVYSVGVLAHDLGISQQRAAMVVSLSALTLAGGKLTFGKLSDVMSEHWVYCIAVTIMGIGVAITSFAGAFLAFACGIVLTTFGQGSFIPMFSSTIAHRFGVASFGRVSGLALIFVQCATCAPFISGLIRDASRNYEAAYLVMLIPLLPAMIAMRWLSAKV